MARLLSSVRAVLSRAESRGSYRETDRLAATLSFYWAGHADAGSPLGRFASTGAVSEATVDALYADLVALEEPAAGSRSSRDGEWTTQAVVQTLLEYAAVHRPRGPVPDWKSLRDDRIAARVIGQLRRDRP